MLNTPAATNDADNEPGPSHCFALLRVESFVRACHHRNVGAEHIRLSSRGLLTVRSDFAPESECQASSRLSGEALEPGTITGLRLVLELMLIDVAEARRRSAFNPA